MKDYLEYFKEDIVEDNLANNSENSNEEESDNTQELINYLKDNRASNRESRAEFAKKIFELALSSNPEARKFIKKVSMFCSFYGDDYSISEDEWKKLNNSEEI